MLVLALTTCTDNPTAPGHGGRAFLALQPVLIHPVDLLSFGLTIDSLRVTVVRPVADTMADTTVFFSPDSTEIHLAIPLVLRAAVETLGVHLALSAGGVVLFTGADTVPVSVAGGGGGGSPVIVPLSYSGPGVGVDRLIVTPIDTALKLSDSLRYQVAAEQGGVPVPSFYVRWTTSDTTRARISAFGVLHAPNHRDTITVIARTISGVADSTRVTFVPTPTLLAIAGGDGQSGPAGAPLPTPLRVRVTAADGLGVKGAVVQFLALAPGGSVAAANVVADDSGFAQTQVTLGPTGGPQQFRASVAGLTPVLFNATALAATVHSADIIANETWTAAQSPHIVTAYLRVRNNATLTIAAGAVVKFDAAAGLQVGDTILGEAGGLVLDGTSAPIDLTANTATPFSGFWQGVKVVKSLPPSPWRRVKIEWGVACAHIRDQNGGTFDLDSLHVRQCGSAGVVLDGGNASIHLHRSQLDTSSIGVFATSGLFEVDSSTFQGMTSGLFMSFSGRLGPSSGNRFLGNINPIGINALQLPGLLVQDTLGGNVNNYVLVRGGRPDSTASLVTLFRQPRGSSGVDYRFSPSGPTCAPLDVGRVGGQRLALDANVVVAFDHGCGILIGDSAGTRSGTFRSLGTSRANAPRLTSAQAVPAPGDWVGVEMGRLFGDDTLKNVRIEYAGDSIAGQAHRFGLLIRSPAAHRLLVDGVVVANTGLASPDTNSAGVLVGAGGAGVEIRRSIADSNRGYGFAISATPVRIVDDTARGNYIGLVAFVAGGGTIAADSVAGNPDSLAGNVLGPGNRYPLQLLAGSLPMLYANTVAGNQRDTLLLGVTPPPGQRVIVKTQGSPPPPPTTTSGTGLYVSAVLPEVPGQRWRVLGPIMLDSSASLRITPDTVVFDSTGGITVGGTAATALQADGTTRAPGFYKLFTATPGHARWDGIEFDNVANGGVLFRNVIVEKAGLFIPPTFGCDCNGTAIAGIRVFDDQSDVTVSLDHLIVRQSITIALDVNRGASAANVTVLGSQFYQNPWNPMIRSPDPRQLVITGSDLYHYHSQVIQSTFAGTDSVAAVDNWWGDVSGPDSTFSFSDSLGRASFDGNAVRYQPYATGPFFPSAIGSAVKLVAARDTIVSAGDTVLSRVGQRDSLRVRALDAEGRGVGGVPVTWGTTSGSVQPGPSGTSDGGGRSGVAWATGAIAGTHRATATAIGATIVFPIDLLPGNTDPASVNWQLDAPFTQGNVTAPKAVTFASTNRRARIIGGSRDGHGNGTFPNELCFADPGGACAFGYGQIDSLKGDTIYFRPLTNLPQTFVLRGLYELGAGGRDSVLITMGQIGARVRIDRDVTTPGTVDTVPNPYLFVALCRNGNPAGGPCDREFHAFVVDSENAPIGNGAANFVWSSPGAPDTTITITRIQGGLAHDSVFVQAHDNGTTWLKVVNTGPQGGQDSMPVLVRQEASNLGITPFADTLLVRQTAAFRAEAFDVGGDTVRGVTVHWRVDEAPPHLSIIDSSVANQVTVRLDSTPFGQTAATAFVIRAPGDTLFGFAYVFNPAQVRINVGAVPFGIAVNASTNRVYVANSSSGDVSVVDGATDAVTATIPVGFAPNFVAVDPGLNKIYVTTDSAGASLAVIDGTTNTLIKTLDLGTSPQGVTVDSINHRVYVATQLNPGPVPFLVTIDATTDTPLVSDTVRLPSPGKGVAFNPVNGLVYVAHDGGSTISVIDPATHTIVQTIVVGATPTTIAVDPGANLVYVTVNGTNNVAIIQAATGAVTDSVSVSQPEGIAIDPNLHRVFVGTTYIYGGLAVFENGPGGLGPARYLPTSTQPYDNPVRVAYNGANGKIYAVMPSFNHITRLQF